MGTDYRSERALGGETGWFGKWGLPQVCALQGRRGWYIHYYEPYEYAESIEGQSWPMRHTFDDHGVDELEPTANGETFLK